MKWSYLLLAGLAYLLPAVATAQNSPADLSPDQLIRNVSNEVLEIIRKDKDIQSGNSKKVIELIDAKVLPHFNFTHMTQLAVGQNWQCKKPDQANCATPAQQKTLTEEFRTLLVRTYSKALTEYKDQKIDFKPFALKAGETDVTVRTQVAQKGKPPIPINYYLELMPQGWKAYDIEVSGVSLVTNYRGEFASEVRSNGIDALIASLQKKNHSLEPK